MPSDNFYINRELSWLSFNRRVLEQATAPEVPLFERLRFVGIFSSNLDEFFMVRAGGLHDRSLIPGNLPDNKTGMTANEQLDSLYASAHILYEYRDRVFEGLEAQLTAAGIKRLDLHGMDAKSLSPIKKYFKHELLPLLSPYLIDPKHPFPHFENKRMYIAAALKKDERSFYGLVPISDALGVVYMQSEEDGTVVYVPVEDILMRFASQIFSKYTVTARCAVRVTRNADVEVDDNFSDENIDMESVDYREYVRVIIKNRSKLAPVRVEYRGAGYTKSDKPAQFVAERLKVPSSMFFRSETPLDLSFIKKLEPYATPAMLFPPRTPQPPRSLEGDMRQITTIACERDLLLVYPYEQMRPYLRLLQEAADDPETVSIKITLYRLSPESEIVAILCRAAENGREVTAVVELKARFDENNNICWSKRLEEAGVHVVYGIGGLKVHSKITLITRRCGREIKNVAHIATGNYNENTARLYCDYGIITTDPEICSDAAEFFRNLTLGVTQSDYKRLWIAPETLKPNIIAKIEEQAVIADSGKPAYICLKMNGLTDKEIIDALAGASKRGVQIDLIIRGVCCLRPAVPDITDNIRVVSIVGRYLEHGRIYIFGAGDPSHPDEVGDRELYIGSADLMTRNTTRRIEICVPILDLEIAARLFKITRDQLRDNVKARWLFSNGEYERPITADQPFDAQTMGEN
jgi:polyphosphate kinase 1